MKVFGEPSWFLIGRTFLHEPSWEYSSNCDEAIFGFQKASLNIFWEYSTNIASDWLRAELYCGQRRNTNTNGWRCRYLLHSLRGEFVYLLTCGRHSLVSETQNEIVVSWITLWGVMKVYWLDLTCPTFWIMLSAARLPQVRAEACTSLQASWEWSKVWTVRTIFGELKV